MTPSRRVLLTVSGRVAADDDRSESPATRPRADYDVLAAAFGADIVDLGTATRAHPVAARVLGRFGPGPVLAWYCWRRLADYDVIVSDGEQVGLPLAMLRRTRRASRTDLARHAMIVHVVTTPSKRRLIRRARLAKLIDRWIVYASAQQRAIVDEFGVDPRRVVLTPFQVDTSFFTPTSGADHRSASRSARPPLVCAAGIERRDYPTMLAAVEHLDAEVVIAAGSAWSTKADSTDGQPIPANVTVRRYDDMRELRDLYESADVVVMPLDDVDFQAGITAILEAMAMARPVVCTRTTGQTDTIVDGRTGWYVPPRDPASLRRSVLGLLDDPGERRRIGDAARRWAVEHADVEVYAARLARVVDELRR